MKKSTFWIIAALFTVLLTGLTACSDSGNDEPGPLPKPEPDPEPKVTLSASDVAPTSTSISFVISCEEADKCAYQVLPSSDAAPSAATVIATGTEVSSDKTTPVTVGDLSPETSYTVYAAAADGQTLSPLEQLKLMTAKTQEEPTTTIELEYPLVANYFGDEEAEDTGNFYFNLVKGTTDERGYPVGEDDYVLLVDLYSAIPADLEHPVISDGTYTFSGEPWQNGTFFVDTQMGGPTFCLRPNFQDLQFVDGSITITQTGGKYSMVADFTMDKDEKIRFTYQGEMPFVNKDLPQPIDVTCTQAEALWQGDLYQMNTSVWSMQMRDVSLNADGVPTSPGTLIDLAFFGDPFADFSEAVLTEGEYTFSNTFAVKTLMRGGKDDQNKRIGSYVTLWSAAGVGEYHYLYDGTMTVSRSGNGYTVVLDALTDKGISVKASYTGEITLSSDVIPTGPYLSTLTHDVALTNDDVTDVTLYDFGEINDGVNTMEFNIDGDDFNFCISLSVALDVTGYVPSGSYPVAKNIEPESYLPFTTEPGWLFDGYPAGGTRINIFSDSTIGIVKSGMVTVERIGETDEYHMSWDLVDDSPARHKITGTYNGVFSVL